MKKAFVLLFLVIFLCFFVSCTNEPSDTDENDTEQQQIDAETDVQHDEPNKSFLQGDLGVVVLLLDEALRADDFDDTITFDDLVKNASEHYFAHIMITGEVVQVLPADDYTQFAIATDGNYDNLIFAETYPAYSTENLAVGDYITIYGISIGKTGYKTLQGDIATAPALIIGKTEQT